MTFPINYLTGTSKSRWSDSNIFSFPQNIPPYFPSHWVWKLLTNHLSPKLGFIPDEVSKKQKWFCPSLFFSENPSVESRYLACLYDLTHLPLTTLLSHCRNPIHNHIYTKQFYTSIRALLLLSRLLKFLPVPPPHQAFPWSPGTSSPVPTLPIICYQKSKSISCTHLFMRLSLLTSHFLLMKAYWG